MSVPVADPLDLDLTAELLQAGGERALVAGDLWSCRLQVRDAAGAVSLTGATVKMTIEKPDGTEIATRQTDIAIAGTSPALKQIEHDSDQVVENVGAGTGKGWFTVRFGATTAERDILLAALLTGAQSALRPFDVRVRLSTNDVRTAFRGRLEIIRPLTDPMP